MKSMKKINYNNFLFVISLLRVNLNLSFLHFFMWTLVFGLPLLIVYITAQIFKFFESENFYEASLLIASLLITMIIRAIVVIYADIVEFKLAFNINNSIRSNLLLLILNDQKRNENIGDLVIRMRNDSAVFGQIACASTGIPLRIVLLISSFILMYEAVSFFSIFACCAVLLVVGLSELLMSNITFYRKKLNEANTKSANLLHQIITYSQVFRVFGSIVYALKRLKEVNNERSHLAQKESFWVAIISYLLPVSMYFMVALFICSLLIWRNAITVGDFIAFTGYLAIFTESLSKLAKQRVLFNNLAIARDRLDTITPQIVNEESSVKLGFENDKSLDLDGVWSTSNIFLISNFSDENNYINKVINELGKKYDAKNILYVDDNPSVISTSIYENIVLDKNPNDQKLNSILDGLDLNYDLSFFPEGLQTLIGLKGGSLSGGQLRRIAIARALVQEPHILILNNPFSGLDKTTVLKLLHYFRELKELKFVIFSKIWIDEISSH